MLQPYKMSMTRRGFTLTEMLVATIVFLIGFVTVFGLFLAGMRFRKLAEDTTRASLTSSSIIEEIRLLSGGSGGTPFKPSQYTGSGFTDVADVAYGADVDKKLFPYPAIPGTWYRVMESTDLTGMTDPNNPDLGNSPTTTVLRLKLLVVPFGYTYSVGDTSTYLTFKELNKRLGFGLSTSDDIAKELVKRGIGFSYKSVITRRPSWLPQQ